jgi:hypothetical protein
MCGDEKDEGDQCSVCTGEKAELAADPGDPQHNTKKKANSETDTTCGTLNSDQSVDSSFLNRNSTPFSES